MTEVYGAVTDRILVNLARHFPYIKDADEARGSFEYQARMLAQMGQVNRESADIIMQSLGGADDALRGALETAILDALKTEEPKLRKAAQKGLLLGGGLLPPELSANQMQAFEAYYQQSADKLNLVNTVMLESTEAAYRATVADAAARIGRTQSILNVGAGEVVTGVSSWNQAMHDAVQKMVANGLTGFIDHGGHKWSPEAYVAMDIRTTMFNTARAAIAERAGQYGADLYQVSSHNGARPLCYPWQGKVISRSGWSGEVEDLEGNTVHVYAQRETSYGEAAGLFGVNCKHYPMTFIPGFSALRGEPQDPEENAEAYALSQQQRAMERKLREEKRDLAVMKAQGADEAAIRAQRERVNRASAGIDEFCNEHDLPRRRNRESAPVRATWPTDTGEVVRYNSGYIGANTVPPQKGVPISAPIQTPGANVAQQATQTAPAAITIETATNSAQLVDAVQREWGVTVDSSAAALDFDQTKRAYTGIRFITERFPEVGDELREVTTSKTGVMSCSGERITFNPTMYNGGPQLQASIARCTASGWWPANTSEESIGVHEAAHGIEWFLDTHNPAYAFQFEQVDAWNKCTEARHIVSEACKAIKRTPFGKGKKNADLIATISKYATKNASDALAESFAAVYCNGAGASPLAQLIVQMTTARYKQFGGNGSGY